MRRCQAAVFALERRPSVTATKGNFEAKRLRLSQRVTVLA